MNLPFTTKNSMFAWTLHLAGVGIIALTLGGFYFLVYQPLQNQNIEQTERSEQLNVLLTKTRSSGHQHRELRKQLTQMQTSIAQVQAQLDSAPTENVWIENISSIATKADLKILDYEIGLTQILPTHSQTEVDFRCFGSYDSICNFLQQTKQLTWLTKLSRFELDTNKISDGYPIQLTFVLYSGAKSHDTKERQSAL